MHPHPCSPGFRVHQDKLDGYYFFFPENWLPVTVSLLASSLSVLCITSTRRVRESDCKGLGFVCRHLGMTSSTGIPQMSMRTSLLMCPHRHRRPLSLWKILVHLARQPRRHSIRCLPDGPAIQVVGVHSCIADANSSVSNEPHRCIATCGMLQNMAPSFSMPKMTGGSGQQLGTSGAPCIHTSAHSLNNYVRRF